jgi:ketosteroid isomerase-like protein
VSAATAWVKAFERAWRAGDGEAAAVLYDEDCVFRSHPFRELDDARAYMRQVIPEAHAPSVWFGVPVELGDRAAIEYWAWLVEPDGRASTIAGCHVARFRDDGRVAEAREYWHLEPGHRPPPESWGR